MTKLTYHQTEDGKWWYIKTPDSEEIGYWLSRKGAENYAKRWLK